MLLPSDFEKKNFLLEIVIFEIKVFPIHITDTNKRIIFKNFDPWVRTIKNFSPQILPYFQQIETISKTL